jgi:integrase/recombinase XerD
MEATIEDFALYFKMRGKSKTTIKSYRKNLLQFCRTKDIRSVGDITRDVINDWILELRERHITDGTIANHLWAIKAFLTWQKKEKQVNCYQFDIQIPKVKDPEFVEYLEPDELEIIFSLINHESINGLRLRTFIEVMINTGLRPTETLNLRSGDIIGNEISIIGKGNKRRRIYFNERARHWIKTYCARRKDSCPSLFVSNPKISPFEPRTLSLRQAEEEFKLIFQKTGIQKRVTPHTLRHTYATTLLSNGCPLDYVAKLLGHAKVETTRKHYAAVQQKHAKKMHFRFLSYGSDAPHQENDNTLPAMDNSIAEPPYRDSYPQHPTYIQ